MCYSKNIISSNVFYNICLLEFSIPKHSNAIMSLNKRVMIKYLIWRITCSQKNKQNIEIYLGFFFNSLFYSLNIKTKCIANTEVQAIFKGNSNIVFIYFLN